MRILYVIIAGSALLAVPIFAQGFLAEELSPRAVSLGGAFVGLADDASAALWNPAGLFVLKGFGVLGRLAMPAPTTPFEIWGAALSGGIFGIGGALWYGSKNIKVPSPEEHTLTVLAVGAGVRETMAAGVALKLYEALREGQRFHGTGIDVGLMARFGWLQGGLAITDIVGTQLSAEEDSFEIPMIVRMGATIKLVEDKLRLLGAVDLARQEELRVFRVGIEFQPFEGIALRAGWDGKALTWGGGLGILNILQTDFTWQADGWAVSTELAFGRR
uniref:PorV/PorQ family protein n=2 Tax=Candidatus Bipolaricaulota TaxID=67810 RepID=H5SFB7_9BACT|nr:hypothetical protein HGMM_F21A08C36 [uncultured Acetothermia bacterium]BAL58567.1 hypothetical protein HGMM_OP2C117 [Candidatus Acetothermum autotrophicum]